jgi:hypothetical protein
MRSAKLWFFAIPLLLAMVAWGSEVGSISGVVTDSSGAAVPRATATVKNLDTAVTRTVTTNDVGAYAFLALPVGRYELSVSAPGFGAYQRTDVVLNTDDELRFDVVLKIGGVTGSVEVAADALHVETANTQLGEVITGTQMENIPLNGREYTDLLALQPGVAPGASTQTSGYNQYFGTTETGSISVSGQRETSNGFFVNGTSVNDALNNGATVVPNLDSIAEFRILTSNFDSEYGNYSGGLVTVVTKTGTNILHGDAFDYVRNTSLDARSFFDGPRNAFVQNQFGGTLGGPIRRDKVFFFADYQGTRSDIGQSAGSVPVPSTAERGGDFSAIAATDMIGTVGGPNFASILTSELGYPVASGEAYYTPSCSPCVFPNGMIPMTAFSAPAQALLKYIPTPNPSGLFVTNANTAHTRDDLFSGRVDFNTNFWGTISAYYFFDDKSINTPFGNNTVPGFPTLSGGRSQLYTLSDTKSFGPNALNEFHLAYNRAVYHNGLPLAGLASLSSLGFNENQPGGIVSLAGNEEGVPTINFNNFTIGNPIVAYNRYENTPSVADNFSKVFGRHTLKFGGTYMFNDFPEPIPLAVANGDFGFNGTETGIDFADFLIGAPTYFVQEGGFDYRNRRNYLGLYVEDSWRVKHNFTVNYGLRWDLIQPWYEQRNQVSTMVAGVQSTVQPGAPEGYVFPGDNVPGYGKIPRGIAKMQYRDFAPRVGIAWSPSANGALAKILGGPDKFSVRAGWGFFYQNGEGEQALDETGEAPYDVFYAAPLPPLFASPYTNRTDGGIHAPFPFSTTNFPWPLEVPIGGYPVVPIGQLVPYVESYSLTLQRQFSSGTVVSLGYLGNQGHHLLTQIANNPGNPQLCLSLSQPSEVAPGSPTCGPFLENQVYTSASGTVYNSTRQPFGGNFTDDFAFESRANSTYNALQLSVRHTSHRATIFAGYTYSKSLDNTSNIQDKPPNPINPRLSRGLSSFDNTHNFVVSYVYALPFDQLAGNRMPRLTSGWRISGVTRFTTGFPIVMYEEDDHSLEGSALNADTPDFLGGSLNLQNPRRANINNGIPYFNTSLFAASAIGSEGSSNRAFFHGPGFNNFDMSLLKDVKLTERASLEFRGEFFNIFNHAQFINPSGNIDGAFGLINAARPGRIGQLVAKFIF